jgi:hypothetical protein
VHMIFIAVSSAENGKMPFPGISDLNARLRRIVAAFQKNHKKELLKQEQNEKVGYCFSKSRNS